ncbi:uncharacterized protein LOC136033098 isoform X2 [Artemia franciscana]|uniref:VWFA domain-containing protein n=1 Tax=Artemia franciscana TaxID=6661 RepID=A0AA88IH59_ARTSF|nr:hypothetical protein QYM36_007903 [Artemia franciscana]
MFYLKTVLVFFWALFNVSVGMSVRRVPDNINVCYDYPALAAQQFQHPNSIHSMLSIIRKLEVHPTVTTWDAARLASSLLRRFRYDGIEDSESQSAYTTPIQKNLPETDKYSLIWSLLPGTAADFPEDALTPDEKCALHFMLSYSVNGTMRAEERFPRQLARERSLDLNEEDLPLFVDASGISTNYTQNDTEENKKIYEDNVLVHQDAAETDEANEVSEGVAIETVLNEEEEDPGKSRKRRALPINYALPISKSPLQRGVIYTPYGTVAAGPVLSGIAAGLEPQTVRLRDWMGSVYYNWSDTVLDRSINNIWGTTIASDIAQSGLLRIHLSHTTVGPSGSWNDSLGICPREFALHNEDPSYLTNAEIYGGIDGLLLGLKMRDWDKEYLKLSDLLSSYYSETGVAKDRSYRACNRISNFLDPNKVNHNILKEEALTFLVAYYDKDTEGNPVFKPSLDKFVKAKQFIDTTYNDLTKLLNNKEIIRDDFVPCTGLPTLPTTEIPRTDTDLLFVIDQFTFSNEEVQRQTELAGFLALDLNIGITTSQMEVLSSLDGSVIVPQSANKAQLACSIRNTVISIHNQRKLHNVLATLRTRFDRDKIEERNNKTSGANGKTVLFSLSGRSPSTQEIEDFTKEYELLKNEHPDVRLLFAVAGTVSSEIYKSFVQEPEKDIFKLNLFTTYKEAASIIGDRARSLSAKLFYPECYSDVALDEASFAHTIYVTPGTQKFYKIMPSTMHLSQNLKIKFTILHGNAEVCLSRIQEPPVSSSALSVCQKNVNGGDIIEFTNYPAPCMSGSCSPIYVAIKAAQETDSESCPDPQCDSPDQVKVVWTHEGMVCSKDFRSGAPTQLVSHVILLVFTLLLIIF